MDLYLLTHPEPALERAARSGLRVKALCFNWDVLEHCRARGIPSAPWEDCIPADQAQPLAAFVHGLADSWYLDPDGGDPTIFEGVSLGKAERYLIWAYYILPPYKFLAGLLAALEDGPVETVFCQSSVPAAYRTVLAETHAQRGGFRLEIIDGTRLEAGDPFLDGLADKMRLTGRDEAKRWARRALGALTRLARAGRSRAKTALVFYYHNLESLVRRMGRRGSPFRLVFANQPPWTRLPQILANGGTICDLRGAVETMDVAQERRLDEIRARWTGLKGSPACAARFLWRGVNLRAAVAPALDRFFGEELETLARFHAFLERLWRRERPSVVLLPSDGPPFMQMIVETARRHKTPSVVLLHGVPGEFDCPFEYTGADHFLVWAPRFKDLYGSSPAFAGKRIAVAGNPDFDRFRPAGRGRPTSLRRILALSNPVTTTFMLACAVDPARYATAIARVARRIGGLDLTLKLHPGESMAEYRALLPGAEPGVRIVKDIPLERCLEEADLVLGTLTTASLTAIVMGKPLLAVNLDRQAFPPPFDGNCGIRQIRGEGELEGALREAAADPARVLGRIVEPYDRILRDFAGPVDGTAADRVLEALDRLS